MRFTQIIYRKIINLSLRRKIFSIIIITNLLLLISTFFGYKITLNAYEETLYNSVSSSLYSFSDEIDGELSSIYKISDLILQDQAIQSELSNLNETHTISFYGNSYRNLYNALQSYYTTFEDYNISYINLFTEHSDIVANRYNYSKMPTSLLKNLEEKAIELEGRPLWTFKYTKENGAFLTRAIRKIDNLDLQTIGTLNIAIDFEKFIKSSSKAQKDLYDPIYLLYSEDTLIYSPEGYDDFENISIKPTDEDFQVVKINGDYYFHVSVYIADYDLKYIGLVPYNTVYMSIIKSIIVFIVIIIFTLALVLLLSNKMIDGITIHFDKLMKKMNAFNGEESSIIIDDYDYSNRDDEIAKLHVHFNEMASEIVELIKTNNEKETLVNAAKLKALETQINPHFLYNCLESLNWRAKLIGANDISSIVESLGSLLRMTLNDKTQMNPLEKEIMLINSYMNIQTFRFEDRLIFINNIDDKYFNTEIPKLTIQPLVENAIKYGVEMNDEPCVIIIEADAVLDDLIIYVKNEGSSFSENFLENLLQDAVLANGFGIGLLNIHRRLQLFYGENYGINLYNEERFAVATIKIPYKK